MSLATCFQRAVQLGVISADEGRELRRRYDDMINKDGLSSQEARDRMARQIQAEADLRERAALMTHIVVDRLIATLENYRDHKGRKDEASAFRNLHENFGQAAGTFIQDAQGLQDAIARSTMTEMKDVMRELRRGAFLGDLRRELNPKVRARVENITKEIMGISTDDARAKILAKAWVDTAEKLRVRFNEAGGAIGKLQGGYIPQAHDQLALLAYKKGPWVAYMMEKGRLDRDRMVDQNTGEKLTDSQLRQGLEVSWDRITTDGYYDADIASPQGKGALYTQHMDHRFIHFATPDHWLEYSKRFGNGGDVYAAMMGHIGIMARDIAHMEVFGPNPNRTREFLKQHMIARAKKSKSNAVVLGEQKEELKRLAVEMSRNTPEYDTLLERHAAIMRDIDMMRSSLDHNSYIIQTQIRPVDNLGAKAANYQQKYDNAIAELQAVQNDLNAYQSGERDMTLSNPAAEAEFRYLLDHMRDAITVASHKPGDLAIGWVNSKIRRADAMWNTMRGGEVDDPVSAGRMTSVRNVLAAGSLGSALFSSLTDPAWGQDMRMRMGQGFARSNFARIMAVNMKEMITMGSREDAIAGGFGLDSAQRVLHRKAKEAAGWDHQFWTAYVTDRVLTTGMLLPWTQAGKHMFALDTARFFAEISSKDWNGIPEGTRKFMLANGLGQREWARLRLIPKHEGLWLRPTEVIAADRTLGERYLQMILRAQRHAIPEATVASSSLVVNKAAAGTIEGELLRSMMQFKGFAFGMMMLHPLRIARELGAGDARGSVAGYAATMFITSTMLGMVAIALKDIKDGRDPRKWLDEKTWVDPFYIWEAILQAGGLGILGDFIRASDNRMGGGLAGTIAGPLAGKVENVGRIAFPQVRNWMRGKEITSEEEMVRLLRSGTVPFSNHFVLAAWYQRAVMDNLQKMADPKAYSSLARKEADRQRDYNQGHWYRPGQTWPHRFPDLTRPLATR